jgi:hypothetical protein
MPSRRVGHPVVLTAFLSQIAMNLKRRAGFFSVWVFAALTLGGCKAYVPKDLDDCFVQLEKILSQENIAKIRNGSEERMIDYHFGLGMWMRNNWGLWSGSRLARWFNGIGIYHPDDMSGIILTSYWRHLHGVPVKLDEQVRYYQDYWKKIKKLPRTLAPFLGGRQLAVHRFAFAGVVAHVRVAPSLGICTVFA